MRRCPVQRSNPPKTLFFKFLFLIIPVINSYKNIQLEAEMKKRLTELHSI